VEEHHGSDGYKTKAIDLRDESAATGDDPPKL
jgi:hypothetical protein